MLFGIPESIILDKGKILLGAFFTTIWENMDMNLPKHTTFHPNIYVKTKVVNMTGIVFEGL